MKRLNVTRERIMYLIRITNSDSKSETYTAECELCKLLSAVIDAKYQVEHYTDNYIIDYPYDRKIHSIEDLSFYGSIGKFPKEIVCNADEYDDFVFDTEWLDINLDEYFNKLQNESIMYVSNLKKQYTTKLKNIDKQIERLTGSKISDLEFQINN